MAVTTETLTDDPDAYPWIVPAGVTSITAGMWGAGMRPWVCTIPTTPGETLTYVLGGAPDDAGNGGYNGGGDGPYLVGGGITFTTAGGGATEIRRGSTALAIVGGAPGICHPRTGLGGDPWWYLVNGGGHVPTYTDGFGRVISPEAWSTTLTSPPSSSDITRTPGIDDDLDVDPAWTRLGSLVSGGTSVGADGDLVTSGGIDYYIGGGGGGYGGGGRGTLYERDVDGDLFHATRCGRPGGNYFDPTVTDVAQGSTDSPNPRSDIDFIAAHRSDSAYWRHGSILLSYEATASGWTIGSIGF